MVEERKTREPSEIPYSKVKTNNKLKIYCTWLPAKGSELNLCHFEWLSDWLPTLFPPCHMLISMSKGKKYPTRETSDSSRKFHTSDKKCISQVHQHLSQRSRWLPLRLNDLMFYWIQPRLHCIGQMACINYWNPHIKFNGTYELNWTLSLSYPNSRFLLASSNSLLSSS